MPSQVLDAIYREFGDQATAVIELLTGLGTLDNALFDLCPRINSIIDLSDLERMVREVIRRLEAGDVGRNSGPHLRGD